MPVSSAGLTFIARFEGYRRVTRPGMTFPPACDHLRHAEARLYLTGKYV